MIYSNTAAVSDIINSVIIFEEWNELEWLQVASKNSVFAFFNDPAEDIYSMDDGIPFHDDGYTPL